jgi:hypothetical protein
MITPTTTESKSIKILIVGFTGTGKSGESTTHHHKARPNGNSKQTQRSPSGI